MKTVVSADGTKIAFDQTGEGPPVILVVGAFNDRATGAPLAKALESRFTVLNYDRRGRGASGDTQPYAVEREVEDLDALIREVGGAARVFGYSSGGSLALEAAARGLNITKLALYEAPFMVGDDDSRPRPPKDMARQLAKLVASGRRGDAVELFQTEMVGIPEQVVVQIRHAPFRPALEAAAHGPTEVNQNTDARRLRRREPSLHGRRGEGAGEGPSRSSRSSSGRTIA